MAPALRLPLVTPQGEDWVNFGTEDCSWDVERLFLGSEGLEGKEGGERVLAAVQPPALGCSPFSQAA